MFKAVLFFIVSSTFATASDCTSLYNNRGLNLDTTIEAYECLDNLNADDLSKLDKSINLNKMAYLKFFEASYYNNNSISSLVSSFNLAKDSIKLYAPLFNKEDVVKLPTEQVEQVALSYYLYGTSVSKYVDLRGKWEAIKRMSEIKNTMRMILSLKKPNTFHYGAYRTLAIFNLKVPKIAGGDIKRSGMFFKKLMQESKTSMGISSYPVGHIYYAEYLKRIGKKKEACDELELIKSLSDSEIESNFRDLIYETKSDRAIAESRSEQYSC